ncbi:MULTISPECIES: protein phosphatase 2C domain-containing protein [Mycolicibacterium]|uniref:protein phosphatase 2C domain-containing protein n=1 Tax=Mycolicibacterium TaxID=1866885 RepID=UPI000A05AEF5|nr:MULTISPECIES: protein phosphatase 2C domain-containing protein [Mycolicibacterium]MCV7335584.1 protein phosphatase 2C domain-containing protein [Mycolicibacterium senegalense]MDR7288649.1 serine/threonine protein phosphatase PrpC [Mycolicibacterium senegalense]QZA25565.1 protein phosphatase 2C domain-containing protein [Mycolicibacterium senegalense]
MAESPKRRWAKRLRPRNDADDATGPFAHSNTSDDDAVEVAANYDPLNDARGFGRLPDLPGRENLVSNAPAFSAEVSAGLSSIEEQSSDRDTDVSGGRPERPPQAVVSEISGPIRVPQLVIGTASPDVEPVPIGDAFRSVPFRPDTVIDGWSSDAMTVLGASLRGHFHRYNGAPRQDDFAIHLMPDGRIIAVVADGVSAATQSHLGSSAVVNYATQWLLSQAPNDTEDTDWEALVKSTAWALTERAQVLFNTPHPDPGLTEKELATTMTCAVVEAVGFGVYRAFVIGIGDSGAWLLRGGEFRAVLDGKAVGEGGISSSAVSGLPRVPARVEPTIVELEFGDVLLLGTDGIGDPLGGGQGGVGNLFRHLFGTTNPPSLLEFAHAVDFSRETFDDDRTLVAIRPRVPDQRGSEVVAQPAGVRHCT